MQAETREERKPKAAAPGQARSRVAARRSLDLMLAGTALAALLILVATLGVIVFLSNDVLSADEWRIQDACLRWSPALAIFTKQNGHSVIFPNALMLLNNAFGQGQSKPLVALAVLANLLTASILALSVLWTRSFRDRGLDLQVLACGLAAGLMSFWLAGRALIFEGALGLEVYLCVLGVVVAALGTAKGVQARFEPVSSATFLMLGGAILATFSFGLGVAVWPMILLCLGLSRSPRRGFVVALAAAAMSGIIFLSGILPSASKVSTQVDLPDLAAFCVVFVGAGLARTLPQAASSLVPMENLSVALGVLGIVLAILASTFLWRKGVSERPHWLLCVGLMWFVVFGSAVVGIARLGLPAGLDTAAAPRYACWGTLFWQAAIVLGLLAILDQPGYGLRRRAAVLFSTSLVVLLVGQSNYNIALRRSVAKARTIEGTLALVQGVEDERNRLIALGRIGHILRIKETLKERRLNIFAERWPFTVGEPLRAHYEVDAGCRALGHFHRVAGLSSAEVQYLRGWSWHETTKRPYEEILLVAEERVVGIALQAPLWGSQDSTAGVHRGPLARALRVISPQLPASLGLGNGSIGLAPVPLELISEIEFFGVSDDTQACALVSPHRYLKKSP